MSSEAAKVDKSIDNDIVREYLQEHSLAVKSISVNDNVRKTKQTYLTDSNRQESVMSQSQRAGMNSRHSELTTLSESNTRLNPPRTLGEIGRQHSFRHEREEASVDDPPPMGGGGIDVGTHTSGLQPSPGSGSLPAVMSIDQPPWISSNGHSSKDQTSKQRPDPLTSNYQHSKIPLFQSVLSRLSGRSKTSTKTLSASPSLFSGLHHTPNVSMHARLAVSCLENDNNKEPRLVTNLQSVELESAQQNRPSFEPPQGLTNGFVEASPVWRVAPFSLAKGHDRLPLRNITEAEKTETRKRRAISSILSYSCLGLKMKSDKKGHRLSTTSLLSPHSPMSCSFSSHINSSDIRAGFTASSLAPISTLATKEWYSSPQPEQGDPSSQKKSPEKLISTILSHTALLDPPCSSRHSFPVPSNGFPHKSLPYSAAMLPKSSREGLGLDSSKDHEEHLIHDKKGPGAGSEEHLTNDTKKEASIRSFKSSPICRIFRRSFVSSPTPVQPLAASEYLLHGFDCTDRGFEKGLCADIQGLPILSHRQMPENSLARDSEFNATSEFLHDSATSRAALILPTDSKTLEHSPETKTWLGQPPVPSQARRGRDICSICLKQNLAPLHSPTEIVGASIDPTAGHCRHFLRLQNTEQRTHLRSKSLDIMMSRERETQLYDRQDCCERWLQLSPLLPPALGHHHLVLPCKHWRSTHGEDQDKSGTTKEKCEDKTESKSAPTLSLHHNNGESSYGSDKSTKN